jgi:dihydroxyacetone kinase-like protein
MALPPPGTIDATSKGVVRPIDATALRDGLARCGRVVHRHARYLTRLDAVLGDGDHGDNLVIGFRAVDELLAELPASTPPGFRAGSAEVLDGPTLAAMFRAAADGLARRGRCVQGDKTILDTLAAAATAFGNAIEAGADVPDAYRAAIDAAGRGMRSTRDLMARRGLAMRLGDRSIGVRDPGAVSCLLLLTALGVR